MRYEYVASRIDESLMPGESAILIISENHGIQFPSDIEVFYVAPRALNELHKWIENWISNSQAQVSQSENNGEGEPKTDDARQAFIKRVAEEEDERDYDDVEDEDEVEE